MQRVTAKTTTVILLGESCTTYADFKEKAREMVQVEQAGELV